jgi:hypothetical protein
MYESPPPQMLTASRLVVRWTQATVGAGGLACLAGLVTYRLACMQICRPSRPGLLIAQLPGYAASVLAGGVVTGLLAPLLIMAVQHYLLRPRVREPRWFLLALPMALVSIFSMLLLLADATGQIDFRNRFTLLFLLAALVPMAGAGLLAGIATSRAVGLDARWALPWWRECGKAWCVGWGLFAIASMLAHPLVIVVAWLACWSIVGVSTGRELWRLGVADVP